MTWTILPEGWITTAATLVAAGLNAVRLARWCGYASWREPLLLVLHVGYGFIPLGYLAVALSSAGLVAAPSALHLLTVGAIGITTLAVMTRATRGHTGRPLTASAMTTTSYACLVVAALLRPLAEYTTDHHATLAVSGVAWIVAFGLFVFEHALMLVSRSPAATKRRP